MILDEKMVRKAELARLVRERDPRSCSLYLMMARDGDGPMYVKVGISEFPWKRMKEVQTGCPILIRRVIAFTCSSRRMARVAELVMHEALAEHLSSGEWFRLEWGPDAKEALHSVIDGVMDAIGGKDLRDASEAESDKKPPEESESLLDMAQGRVNKGIYHKYLNTPWRSSPLE